MSNYVSGNKSRLENISRMGIDRAYKYKMQDATDLRDKTNRIKRLCTPGRSICGMEVVKAFPYHCVLKNEKGHERSFSYIDLADHITFKN